MYCEFELYNSLKLFVCFPQPNCEHTRTSVLDKSSNVISIKWNSLDNTSVTIVAH